MNIKLIDSTMAKWHETLAKLPWNPLNAERSARLALSQAAWLGIDKDTAVRTVFEMGLDRFFEDHPHIPYAAWYTVSEQVANPDEGVDLLAA
jgi:hypothetical protein